jgi:succinate dehydrogenase / fumarate reductase cytochrome b subunit
MWLKDSSIGRKFVMSLTGLALVLFLLFHGCMNVVVVIKPEAYDAICRFLGANWYALVGTLGLAFLVVVHFCYAIYLTIQNRAARGNDRYAISGKKEGVEWESENMLVLGFCVIGFLVLHLYNFWFKMQLAEITEGATAPLELATKGSHYVIALFTTKVSGQIYCVLYLIWLCALWLHLNHGVWSALHTLGWNNLVWMKRIKVIGCIVATLAVLPFMIVVLYYFGYGIGLLL